MAEITEQRGIIDLRFVERGREQVPNRHAVAVRCGALVRKSVDRRSRAI